MKKITILLFAVLTFMMLSSCNEEKMNERFYIIEDQVQKPEAFEVEEETLTADKTVLKLYYPDETKQFILSKMIEVEEINKNTIIEHISELGYIEESTRLVKLVKEEFAGEGKLILAEFSIKLKNKIEKVDPKEGQIIYACIVNTLLDAYDAVGVCIYIGNDLLIYPQADIELKIEDVDLPEGYYPHFELSYEDQFEKALTIDGKAENITYSRFFCEEGYSIYYELENYESGYNETEGLAVFEKNDESIVFCIYLSESSKIDTIESLSNQEVLGITETSESFEMEIGAKGYLAIGIFKKGEQEIINYYIIEKEGQIFVIETKMGIEASREDGERIGKMLDTFEIIK